VSTRPVAQFVWEAEHKCLASCPSSLESKHGWGGNKAEHRPGNSGGADRGDARLACNAGLLSTRRFSGCGWRCWCGSVHREIPHRTSGTFYCFCRAWFLAITTRNEVWIEAKAMDEGAPVDRGDNCSAGGTVPARDCRIFRRPSREGRAVNRQSLLRLLGPLAIAGALAGYLLRTPHTPSGQPALQALKGQDLAAFREDFNKAAGEVRVILLLSPT